MQSKEAFETQRRKEAYEIVQKCVNTYILACTKYFIKSIFTSTSLDSDHEYIAKELYQAGLKFGGPFLKSMQYVGIQNDIREPYKKYFRQAQEDVPIHSNLLAVRKQLKDLSKTVEGLEATPFKAGSIAQVHNAKYKGSAVVVKVQHPGMKERVAFDLNLMAELGEYVDKYQEAKGAANMLKAISNKLKVLMVMELDFVQEATNQKRAIANFAKRKSSIVIPQVYAENDNCIVMQKLDGRTASNLLDELHKGNWNDYLSKSQRKQIYEAYCHMIFDHKFTQTDPHPGNIMIMKDGSIALLDFGQCMEVEELHATTLKKFLVQFPRDMNTLHSSKYELMKLLATLGVDVSEDQALNYVQYMFLGTGSGIFPSTTDIQDTYTPLLLILLYLTRFEHNVCNVKNEEYNPLFVINVFQQVLSNC